MKNFYWVILGISLSGCQMKGDACSADADTDGDGLDDCAEQELGTDAERADSDGDGVSDKEELDCVSNPLDDTEQCYACGWKHNDPGDIASTGSAIGDVMASVQVQDQCAEVVDTWDFYGEYHVLYMTAAW